MTYAATVPRLMHALLLSVLFVFGATDLHAQAALTLSKNADFSTDDRSFDRTDMLYVQVMAPQIDFNDLDKNEFRLKPDEGGSDIEGAFTNHFDGTYTTSVDLSTTDPTELDWEFRTRIEDDDDNEFEARINLTIGTEEGDDDNDGGDDNEVEFTGTIDAIQSDGLSVDGVFFFVDANTSMRDNDDNAITFADLAVGMLVEIRGEHNADGDLIATDIEIEDGDDDGDDDGDEVEFTGTIDDIQSDGLTVDGVFFFVTDATFIRDNDDSPITFGDLAVGMLVEIRGDRDANGDLFATDIEIEDGDGDNDGDNGDDEIEITGEIEALDANSVTVGGFVFVVTSQTLLLNNDNNPIPFNDFAVGMLVEAEGDLQPDGTLVARKIKQEDRDDDEVELRGTIEALSDNAIVVEGIMFAVTTETLVLDQNNNPISFGGLAVGQFVEIEGDIQADGSLVARKIKQEDGGPSSVEMTGIINTFSNDRIVVSDITFLVDDATEVMDANDQPLDRSLLAAGQQASVRGTSETAVLVATCIKLLDVTDTTTAIEDEELPSTITLHQNYPNPFNPTTTISFSLSGTPATVSLAIYNVLGQQIATLVEDVLPAGTHTYTWEAQDERGLTVPSGLYLYRLQMGNQVLARRMLLLK